MLTRQQKACLDYISGRVLPPTHAEIAAALGLKSRGSAHDLVRRLIERGRVIRLRQHSARALTPVLDTSQWKAFVAVRGQDGDVVLKPLEGADGKQEGPHRRARRGG